MSMTGFENLKALAEIPKLKAETTKIAAERRKVENDLDHYGTFFRLEKLKVIGSLGSLGTFLVAIAAVATVVVNIQTSACGGRRRDHPLAPNPRTLVPGADQP
jgi:hypothetical protein